MNDLTKEFVLEKLQKQFPDSTLNVEEPADYLTLEIDANSAHAIIKFLKENSELNINFLTLLGGIHFPENKGREIGVTYHLHNLISNFRIRLKTFLPIEKPEIKSIVDIYVGANWQERETYDFYGVDFLGHPNLTRILNEDSMDYFPMRKEYHLEDGTREDKDDRFFGR